MVFRVSEAERDAVGAFGSLCRSGSDGKESAHNVGDPDSIPGSGRSPGEGHGSPLQYSCPENSMDRKAWQLQSMGSQRLICDFHFHIGESQCGPLQL